MGARLLGVGALLAAARRPRRPRECGGVEGRGEGMGEGFSMGRVEKLGPVLGKYNM